MRVGQRVVMTEEALDNYGEEYRDQIFVIESVSFEYMPAKEFFARNKPDGYHPGYDETAGGLPLYDLIDLNFSLYWWEVKRA